MNELATTSGNFGVAALYKFTALSDLPDLQQRLQQMCGLHSIRGTLLIAPEGINGTISAPHEALGNFLSALQAMPEIGELDIKFSSADDCPFLRMKVRIKKEIVTLGVPEADPTRMVGQYVEPKDWNALVDDPDVTVVDTRNSYEVAIGTFAGALNPETDSFGQLPDWADGHLDEDRDKPIAMFCTGGIRCEKSTALLRARGYRNIFHLKGGILKYLEEIEPEESRWKGECFVFDNRVSVKHGLEQGSYDLCHACRMPISDEDKADTAYEKGVSCPRCVDNVDPSRQVRFAERQKQIELAEKRRDTHLAADLQEARRKKKLEREEQRRKSAER